MTQPSPLRLIDDADAPVADLAEPQPFLAEEPEIAPPEPKVFSRTISTPGGAPWDQARAAALEARVGAPLPLGEVVYRVRRLDGWSPGRPGRYVAFYVRSRDVGDGFETTVTVDGRPVEVSFLPRAEQARRAQRSLTILLASAAAGLVIALALATAIGVHANIETRLADLEQQALARQRDATLEARQRAQARALNALGARGSSINDYLSDLAWATASKAPDAHIDALHWQHGYMGVEVRGSTAPFAAQDRTVIKADKPVRPGVWLWGVAPAGLHPSPAAAAPVVAGPSQ